MSSLMEVSYGFGLIIVTIYALAFTALALLGLWLMGVYLATWAQIRFRQQKRRLYLRWLEYWRVRIAAEDLANEGRLILAGKREMQLLPHERRR